MKKIFRTSLAILLISVAVGSTALATPSVNQLKEDKKKAQKELDQIKKDITNLMTNINKGEQQLVEVGQAVIKAEADLAEAEEKEQIQYEAMKHRIVAMYENGTGMMLAKVLDAGNLAEMIKQAEHVQTIHEYDRKQLAEYVAVKQKIANLKESLENDMAVIQKQQKQFEKDKASLNRKISQLQGKISNFDEEIRKAAQNSGSGGGSSSGSGYVPPVGTGGGAAVVKEAYRYLGAMYVWGGESLSGVDCSGLVKMAHKAIGVNLPHYSNSIGSGGRKVSKAEALPGDVVCYYGHVGIYLGNGMMIHAPDFGQRVRVQAVYGSPWYRRYW
jgi:cell wall-associated NlpC family hydrolase